MSGRGRGRGRGGRALTGRDLDAAAEISPANNSGDPSLPIGSTLFYIAQLEDPKLDAAKVENLVENFDDLSWTHQARSHFMDALLVAAGRTTRSGFFPLNYFWGKPVLTPGAVACLKFLSDIVKTHSDFLTTLKGQPVALLKSLNLGLHVTHPTASTVALDFVRLLVQQPSFSNYLLYIADPPALEALTKFLQAKDGKKRKRDDNDDAPDPKRAKRGGNDGDSEAEVHDDGTNSIQWFWAADGPGNTSTWIKYTDAANALLERGYQAGSVTLDVDKQRYVDFKNMLQRRVDDPDKVRKIKRQVTAVDQEPKAD